MNQFDKTRARKRQRFPVVLALLLASGSLTAAAQTEVREEPFQPTVFVQAHCLRCHGPDKQKGDRRFDALQADFAREKSLDQWQEILDVINAGDMPPDDEDQPPATEISRFVASVTGQLDAAQRTLTARSQVSFRRLNRYEYLNTIRDLCGVNIESFDPTVNFPSDERWDGFDNIADELVISDYLLQRYLEASSQIIDKAAQQQSSEKPRLQVFMPNDLCDRKFHFRPQISFQVNVDGSYVDVGHGDRMSDRVVADRLKGVPVDGYYTIRIKAEGINREHPYDPKLLGIDPEEPIKMEVLVADPNVGSRLSGNPTDRSLSIIPLKDHETKVYELRTWMDKGFVPVLRYINGPQPIKAVLFRIAPKYHAEVLPSNWRSGTDRRPAEPKERYMSDVYQGPRMRVHWIELEGPETVRFQATSRAALFGKEAKTADTIDPDQVLTRFLFRAFRRPPTTDDLTRYRDFMSKQRQRGESEETALLTTFKAILCSPNFLYIETPVSKPPTTDTNKIGFKVASRLSYFLWSSMPDDLLLEAASQGKLSDPKQRVAHALRMLRDPRAKAFTQHFTDSWLHLNELGSMPPDEVKFPTYHKRRLQALMKEETRFFFNDILRNNRSIKHFLDADFTYVNRYLADHYGIPTIVGDQFQKVSLPKDSLRGGLLGHASILTATSNGVETSPVTRGIWILENILGLSPPPPPPDVEPLEPDIRGATTIREQLAKHRDVITCAECHRKIDPLGFALESFDPIGSSRSSYLNSEGAPAAAVDTSGTLSTGEHFENLTALKALLLARTDQFTRCLTEKLLTYALGRKLSFRDRPTLDAIPQALAARGYRLRDLVELIVASDAFADGHYGLETP